MNSKNYTITDRFLAFFLLIMLLAGVVFSAPASVYAEETEPAALLPNIPDYGSQTAQDLYSASLLCVHYTYSSSIRYRSSFADSDDVYITAYISGTGSSSLVHFVVGSSTPNTKFGVVANSSTAGYTGPYVYDLQSEFDGLYYFDFSQSLGLSNPANYLFDIPVYDDLSACLSALSSALTDSPAGYSSLRVAPGYLLTVQGAGTYTITLSTKFPVSSSVGQWAYSTQRYGIENSLPSVDNMTSYDYGYGTRILFTAVPPYQLFNQGLYGSATITVTLDSDDVLYLINPPYYGTYATLLEQQGMNNTMQVDGLEPATRCRIFALGTTVSSGVDNIHAGGYTSTISTSAAVVGSGLTVATNGAIIDDATGLEIADSSESLKLWGDTDPTDPNGGPIEVLTRVVEDFAKTVQKIIVAPAAALQSVISSFSTFFVSIAGIWTWLPPELSSLIIACLSVMVVIGVVRLLR